MGHFNLLGILQSRVKQVREALSSAYLVFASPSIASLSLLNSSLLLSRKDDNAMTMKVLIWLTISTWTAKKIISACRSKSSQPHASQPKAT